MPFPKAVFNHCVVTCQGLTRFLFHNPGPQSPGGQFYKSLEISCETGENLAQEKTLGVRKRLSEEKTFKDEFDRLNVLIKM